MTQPVPPTLRAILERRSLTRLLAPGPSFEQLELVLRAALTVPDHGSLRPYRFLVVEGEGRARFGRALALSLEAHRPGATPVELEWVSKKAYLAPTLVALVAAPHRGHKVAEWEQLATAACAGYAITLAASTLGLGAIWKSVQYPLDARAKALLGLLSEEVCLGWINLGTPAPGFAPPPRPELSPAGLTTVFDGGEPRGFAPR